MTPAAARTEPAPENGQAHYEPREGFGLVMTLCHGGGVANLWEAEIGRTTPGSRIVLLYGEDFNQVLADAVEMIHLVP